MTDEQRTGEIVVRRTVAELIARQVVKGAFGEGATSDAARVLCQRLAREATVIEERDPA